MILSDEQFAVVAAKDAEIERLTALMTDREQEILYWMKVAGDNAGISDARLAEVEECPRCSGSAGRRRSPEQSQGDG